jgi:hypothetical protein
LPDVDPDGAAAGQAFGRADQHEPVTASDIEHLLVAPPGELIEHFVPQLQFADPAAPGHDHRGQAAANSRRQAAWCPPVQPLEIAARGHKPKGEPSEREKDARDRQPAHHDRGIQSIIWFGSHLTLRSRPRTGSTSIPGPASRRCARK